jgi:hypothetical protein
MPESIFIQVDLTWPEQFCVVSVTSMNIPANEKESTNVIKNGKSLIESHEVFDSCA